MTYVIETRYVKYDYDARSWLYKITAYDRLISRVGEHAIEFATVTGHDWHTLLRGMQISLKNSDPSAEFRVIAFN